MTKEVVKCETSDKVEVESEFAACLHKHTLATPLQDISSCNRCVLDICAENTQACVYNTPPHPHFLRITILHPSLSRWRMRTRELLSRVLTKVYEGHT